MFVNSYCHCHYITVYIPSLMNTLSIICSMSDHQYHCYHSHCWCNPTCFVSSRLLILILPKMLLQLRCLEMSVGWLSFLLPDKSSVMLAKHLFWVVSKNEGITIVQVSQANNNNNNQQPTTTNNNNQQQPTTTNNNQQQQPTTNNNQQPTHTHTHKHTQTRR